MISLVRAGIALDITDYAEEHGFGVETVFDAARSSIAVPNDRGELRQYAYPCNVGYTVLMYHRDLLANAGVAVPTGGWTIDEMRRAGERVLAVEHDLARPLFAVMNLDPFNTALGAGGRLFNSEAATHCVFNSPATVAGLGAYRDLMYEHGAMPRPAEAASMSASTAGGFGSDVSGSAPGLFAQKSIAMYVGGRWEYVIFAIANRDRVVVPAIDRRLDRLASDAREAELLRAARASLVRDVLVPIGDDAHAAVEACLTEEDRARLLHIGIAHIPTVTGEPYYAASARGAAVNRALARDDPDRLVYAMRFLRFLGSEPYNEQINGTYDSICGSIAFCTDEDGISGPPAPLPGLTGFDSPVYTEAMLRYAEPWEVSPYIGRTRLMTLMGEVLQDLQGGAISAQEAAARIEESINRQIIANVRADAGLRERWSAATGIDPGAIDTRGSTPIRAQIEARTVVSADRAAAGGQR
jgi:ABC-type glycerol-3-phosphate transport system substrate-binding protein